MARSRNIKPGFFTNEALADCGPLAHLLFASLWCIADREGRIEDRPRRLKVQCLPFYDCDINALLDTLANAPEPFIQRYEVDGRKCIQVVNWQRHQKPHHMEAASEIPGPRLDNDSTTSREQVEHEPSTPRAPVKGISVKGIKKEESGIKAAPRFDGWWEIVHAKIGRGAALKAYNAAVKRLAIKHDDPHAFLLDRMKAFAASPNARPPDRTPIHPATWLNHDRFDDDPATWNHTPRAAPHKDLIQL